MLCPHGHKHPQSCQSKGIPGWFELKGILKPWAGTPSTMIRSELGHKFPRRQRAGWGGEGSCSYTTAPGCPTFTGSCAANSLLPLPVPHLPRPLRAPQPKIFSSSRNQHPNSLQGSVRALSSYRAVPKALQAAAKNKLRQHTLQMNPGGAKSPSRAAAAPF